MGTALIRAASLRPEIRLAQAISQFEADLPTEEKTNLKSYRFQARNNPPNIHDVMRLTSEFNSSSAQRFGVRRCFGPRLTNLLEAIQQFAALGDLILGNSQNTLACGIWGLVRITIVVSLVVYCCCIFLHLLITLLSTYIDNSWIFIPRRETH